MTRINRSLLEPEWIPTTSQIDHLKRVELSFDAEMAYRYPDHDACALCGKELGRLNPHVVCFVCIYELQHAESHRVQWGAIDLLNARRLPRWVTSVRRKRVASRSVERALKRLRSKCPEGLPHLTRH